MSGRVTRALEGGLTPSFAGDWTQLADAPSLWPIEGRVASSFGQREDPINGEGRISPRHGYRRALWARRCALPPMATLPRPRWRTATGARSCSITATICVRFTAISRRLPCLPGQHVTRGQVIGYVGQTGRATGPHLHYEVRIHNVPVNPHKFLRTTYEQAFLGSTPAGTAGK